jgi:hypothetical protein
MQASGWSEEEDHVQRHEPLPLISKFLLFLCQFRIVNEIILLYRTLPVLNSQRSSTKVASFSSFCSLCLSTHTHTQKAFLLFLVLKFLHAYCALSLGQYTLFCQLVLKLKFICCLSWYKPYTFICTYRGKPSYHTDDTHSYQAVNVWDQFDLYFGCFL